MKALFGCLSEHAYDFHHDVDSMWMQRMESNEQLWESDTEMWIHRTKYEHCTHSWGRAQMINHKWFLESLSPDMGSLSIAADLKTVVHYYSQNLMNINRIKVTSKFWHWNIEMKWYNTKINNNNNKEWAEIQQNNSNDTRIERTKTYCAHTHTHSITRCLIVAVVVISIDLYS